ncbi:ribonuclease H-like domain-containing protein, partial [Tanacetum coccineum]
GFNKSKLECFNCHNTGHFARDCKVKGSNDERRRDLGYKGRDQRTGKQKPPKALLTINDGVIDWIAQAEEDEKDHALMTFNLSNSSNEVQSCFDKCVASYNKLKKLYDEQKEQIGVSSVEIIAYKQGLRKVEARVAFYQKEQLCYEEEMFDSLLKCKEDDSLGKPLYNMFVKAKDMKGVPPPMLGNYTPTKTGLEIGDSLYTYGTYGPKQPESSDTRDKSSDFLPVNLMTVKKHLRQCLSP